MGILRLILSLLPVGLMLSVASAHAQNADWQGARTLFEAGKYADALQLLKANPSDDAAYFYDLGTIYSKIGDSGKAVAYLEKANLLEQHHPDIQNNLRLSQTALAQQIGGMDKLDPASTWTESLASRVSIEEVRGALGVAVLILAAFWIRIYRKTSRLRATFLNPSALICSLGLLIVSGMYWVETSAASVPAAVLLQAETVRSGPGAKFQELEKLPAGVKVRQLEGATTGEGGTIWRQIRYSQDAIGWIPVASLLSL